MVKIIVVPENLHVNSFEVEIAPRLANSSARHDSLLSYIGFAKVN